MLRKLLSISVLSLLLLAVFNIKNGYAQSPSLELSPAKTTINANPGDNTQFALSIKNTSTKTSSISVVFNNFTSSDDESGTPKLATEQVPYGLSSWLSSDKSISAKGSQTSTVTISINVPIEAKAGTYYGMVRFANAGNDLTSSVASLVFVNVGQTTQSVSIEEFSALDDLFVARIKNTGNGFTTPSVKIEIIDDGNKVIDTLDANPKAGGIIPGTIRKYSVARSDKIDPGSHYTARLSAKTESHEPAVTKELTIGEPEPAPVATIALEKKGLNPIAIIAWVAILGPAIIIATSVVLREMKRHKGAPAARFESVVSPPSQTTPKPFTPSATQPANPAAPAHQTPKDNHNSL